MDLPVSIATKKLPHASPKVTVYYPVVIRLPDNNVQSPINHAIITTLNKLLVEQNFYDPNLVELLANFEIKPNSGASSA